MITTLDPVDNKHLTVFDNFISKCFVKDLPDEEWFDLPGYSGFYKISNKARIKSLIREIEMSSGSMGLFYERVMKKTTKINDYWRIELCKNSVRKNYLVHRLMAIVFIPNPRNYKYVNHIDGDKSNCTLPNLEWCTAGQNQIHAYRIGLKKPGNHNKGQDAHKAILDDSDVVDIKIRLSKGELSRDLAMEYNVSQACLSHIKTGKRWTHI